MLWVEREVSFLKDVTVKLEELEMFLLAFPAISASRSYLSSCDAQ